MKKAGSGGWKQRYANLEGASLVYYENNFMSAKTQAGEISLSQARVMPCRFAGAAPTPAGMAVATGFVLSSKSSGDFFFMRSDAEKTNKAAMKAKKKAEKEDAKAAAKAAKAEKKGGGGDDDDAPKGGPLTPAQKLQSQADGAKKLSKQVRALVLSMGAFCCSRVATRGVCG
jgi:hypothetical protein